MRMMGVLMILALLTSMKAVAGEADVIDVDVRKLRNGTYHFAVTLRHGDTGWKHYADRWDVVTPDGTVLGSRVLAHPHVREQPFTRSLSGVKIPAGITQMILRANDSVHGTGGKTMTVDLPK